MNKHTNEQGPTPLLNIITKFVRTSQDALLSMLLVLVGKP